MSFPTWSGANSFQSSMRILTFNVHGCVGLDFHRSEERIARRIAELAPDLAALQELDVGRARSGHRHQANLIARHLRFQSHFHPAMRWDDEHYGNALLSRWPLKLRHAAELPSAHAFPFRETRAASWLEIATPSGPLHVINTHLGVGPRERREQAEALLGRDWLGAIPLDEPTLLVGDLNSGPRSAPYARLASSLEDLVKKAGGGHPRTFPSFCPALTLDHIFGNARIQVTRVHVPRDWDKVVVSDHLPIVMDFEIVDPPAGAQAA